MDVARLRLAALAAGIIGLGLFVRFAPIFPDWLQDAGGGILYVCLIAVLVRFAGPNCTPFEAACVALAFTVAIELSQALNTSRLVAARSTLVGRLVLGSTFSWWDFPPYFIGTAAAGILLRSRSRQRMADGFAKRL